MTARTPQPLTGPLRFIVAVADSNLRGSAKLVLGVGFMPHLDFDTWRAFPSEERIGQNCGRTSRAVRKELSYLRKRDVVVLERRGSGKAGFTNHYRIDMAVLEGLAKPENCSGSQPPEPEENNSRTGNPRPENRNFAPPEPEQISDQQTREQTREQTTTITTVGPQPPNAPAVPVGGGAGGGASLLAAGPEKTAEGGHCPQESERLLVAFGVSKGKAVALAAAYPPPEVNAGIAWVKANAPDANNPPGLLVRMLEDGTAEEYRRTLDRERARREEEERLDRERVEQARLERLAGLISMFLKRVSNGISDQAQDEVYDRGLAAIKSAWSQPLDAAQSGVLSEADLTDPAAEPDALFNRLVHAAKAAVAAQGNQPADEPNPAPNGTTGGTP